MRHLKNFNGLTDANTQGAAGLYSPHISIINGKTKVNAIKTITPMFTCSFDENGEIGNVEPIGPHVPNDEIWYTTWDNTTIDSSVIAYPGNSKFSGIDFYTGCPHLVSNTYSNGQGVLKFDGDVTRMGYEEINSHYENGISITFADDNIEEDLIELSKIKTITIPSSVTKLAQLMFAAPKLTDVYLPNTITECNQTIDSPWPEICEKCDLIFWLTMMPASDLSERVNHTIHFKDNTYTYTIKGEPVIEDGYLFESGYVKLPINDTEYNIINVPGL